MPATRIAEDYLRILRFFRFHAYYGEGHPDAAGLHAAIVARAGLEQLSRERVRMELMKLLLAPHAVPALAVMAEAGLLGPVLGGVPHLASFANMAKVGSRVRPCARRDAAARRARRVGRRGCRAAVAAAAPVECRARAARRDGDGWWRVSPAMGEAAARALIYRIGPEHFAERVLLAWARSGWARTMRRGALLRRCRSAGPRRRFRCEAADFIARGVEKGPALGAALARAEEAWIAVGLSDGSDALERDYQSMRSAASLSSRPSAARAGIHNHRTPT